MNCFRSIQKRLTIEMRELGTRDKVLGDALSVRPKEVKMSEGSGISEDDTTADETNVTKQDFGHEATTLDNKEDLNITRDPLIELNKYKFGK